MKSTKDYLAELRFNLSLRNLDVAPFVTLCAKLKQRAATTTKLQLASEAPTNMRIPFPRKLPPRATKHS